jgi:hypothetical protein
LALAYTHQIGLEIEPAAVRSHFAAARDRCLNDATLHCILLNATIGQDQSGFERDETHQSGQLRMRLLREQVARYANALTNPLPGEQAGMVHVVQQSTMAEDLSRPIEDTVRRMAQLADYRDRLTALAARAATHVDDLVKIAGELSQVQSKIEAAQAEQRDLGLRVATEELDVDFNAARREDALDPLRHAWIHSREIFWRSVADALEFAITAVPWLPLLGLALLAIRFVRRLVFGKLSDKAQRGGAA